MILGIYTVRMRIICPSRCSATLPEAFLPGRQIAPETVEKVFHLGLNAVLRLNLYCCIRSEYEHRVSRVPGKRRARENEDNLDPRGIFRLLGYASSLFCCGTTKFRLVSHELLGRWSRSVETKRNAAQVCEMYLPRETLHRMRFSILMVQIFSAFSKRNK